MKKDICEAKVRDLAQSLQQKIVRRAMELYSSGGVDTTAYRDDSYALPKVLITAAMRDVEPDYHPMFPGDMRVSENLAHF